MVTSHVLTPKTDRFVSTDSVTEVKQKLAPQMDGSQPNMDRDTGSIVEVVLDFLGPVWAIACPRKALKQSVSLLRVYFRKTPPHSVIVTKVDNKDDINVLLYS